MTAADSTGWPQPVTQDETQMVSETLSGCPVCSASGASLASASLALWRCASCGVLYNSPRPTQQFIEKNYNEGQYYATFTPDQVWEEMWQRRLARVLEHGPRSPILDVSAGVGTTVKQLRARGFDALGSEISKEALARARQVNGVELIEGYPEELALKEGSLGCVMMWHVFEHLPFPGRALKHLAGKIAPGGLLVIAVPNAAMTRLWKYPKLWFASRDARLEKIVGRIDYESKFQEIHLIHFPPPALRRVVEAAGFQVLHHGVDNALSVWRDSKIGLRNFLAKLGFNDSPAQLLIARKTA
jgi:2-polyprenyl-3-methyl-5-hydroxy-6-metoxy-1,4-benzoquinol methylase